MKEKDLKVFAYIWSGIFMVIGLYPLITSAELRYIPLSISIVFILIAAIRPVLLAGFYKVWIEIGEFIGGIVSKVIMFILYFGLFTPVSIFLKISGKDLLNKKVDKSQNSYWIKRERQPESMKNQF